MGTATSKTIQVKQATIPSQSIDVQSYPNPFPPLYNLDDIKIPISCYDLKLQFEDDGFNWSEILNKDEEHNEQEPAATKNYKVTDGQYSRTGLRTDAHNVIKQQPPSVKRPIRSITLQGRSKVSQLSRQRSFTPHRSPNISRKSTPTRLFKGVKIDFSDIDRHAKEASKIHRQSYDLLMQYLLEPIGSSSLSEIKTARVLIVWLARQSLKSSRKWAGTSTPEGLLQAIVNGTETFASAYVILCRQAGLPCILIEGSSKSFTYTPDNVLTSDMDDEWTAVYCEGSWQLVHPNKAFEFKNEDLFNVILDDFFMPNPVQYIYTCFPDDESWQLLPKNHVVTSVEAFLKLPCIFPSLFKLGLTLENEFESTLSTECGTLEISFSCCHTFDNRICLLGKLSSIDTDFKEIEHEPAIDFRHCLLFSRQNKRFAVEIRLPRPGKYKLEIFGRFTIQSYNKLCNFSIECKTSPEDVSYMPFPTDKIMWGPSVACDEAGLMVPSQMIGVIDVPMVSNGNRLGLTFGAYKFHNVHFQFMLHLERTKEFEFFAHLRRTKPGKAFKQVRKDVSKKTKVKIKKPFVDQNSEDTFYAEFVKCERNEDGRVLTISVTLPHAGEFGLMITKRRYIINKRKQKIFVNKEDPVCAYFLKANGEPMHDNVHLKLARERMVALIYGTDRTRLIDAIEKYKKINTSRNECEIYNAEKWCEYLKHKADMNDAIHRRNINFIDNSLRRVAEYRYKAILHSKISRVFHLRHQLIEIRSLQKYEPYLKQAAFELSQIDQPQRPVHDTMAAVLLIFGEIEKKIEDWSYIRKQLRSESLLVDPPLMRKIQYISEVCPTKNDTRKIITLLQQHKIADIREENPSAIYFHIWAVKVMSVLEDTEPCEIGDFPDNLNLSQLHVQTSTQPGLINPDDTPETGSEQRTCVSQQGYSTNGGVSSSQDQIAYNTVFDNNNTSGIINVNRSRIYEESENKIDTVADRMMQHSEKTGAFHFGSTKELHRNRSEIGVQTDID